MALPAAPGRPRLRSEVSRRAIGLRCEAEGVADEAALCGRDAHDDLGVALACRQLERQLAVGRGAEARRASHEPNAMQRRCHLAAVPDAEPALSGGVRRDRLVEAELLDLYAVLVLLERRAARAHALRRLGGRGAAEDDDREGGGAAVGGAAFDLLDLELLLRCEAVQHLRRAEGHALAARPLPVQVDLRELGGVLDPPLKRHVRLQLGAAPEVERGIRRAASVGAAPPKAFAAGDFAPLALALAPALLLAGPAAVRGAETRRGAMLASHRSPTFGSVADQKFGGWVETADTRSLHASAQAASSPWYHGSLWSSAHGVKLLLQFPRAGVDPFVAHEEHVQILMLKLSQRSPDRIQDPRLGVAESVAAEQRQEELLAAGHPIVTVPVLQCCEHAGLVTGLQH
eukprot:scaffold131695_cov69-Phaeocystis_antarctica.AAC.7